MKLNIPEQNAPTKTSSPSNPRKLKKHLSDLPNANMGELTRQIYQILRDQNRQTMSNMHRLENLEMLRTLARGIFDNLKKYFVNRTLPLPEKSQKIINLNQSMLQELIHGYEIIASEAANRVDEKIDDKTLAIAICRSLSYLSEMLLRSSEVYGPCPKNLWHDAHQLYKLAEKKNLIDNVVADQERETKTTTIGNSYKQILLFALARPASLRQSDSDRVHKELFKWSQYATIQSEAAESLIDHVFCMQINEDRAPGYLNQENIAMGDKIRILDTGKLITHVTGLIAAQSKEKQKLAVGDTIPLETLNTLVNSWGASPKRGFSRAERHGHINVAIGLVKIHQAISAQSKTETPPTSNRQYGFVQTTSKSNKNPINDNRSSFISPGAHDDDSGLSLQSMDDGNHQIRPTHASHSAQDSNQENKWDLVARGRVLTESYEQNRQLIEKNAYDQPLKNADTHWQVVNISAGGYCLRWNSDNTSKAQIGELIALQEFDAQNDFKWHVGVIRWMQFTHEDGLEIGVQILSPKMVAVTAQRISRPDEAPFACLMLPGIEALNQTSSTLLPAHAFTTSAKLLVQAFEHKLNITLGEIKEQTGSFTQFSYSDSSLKQQTEKQEEKEDSNKPKDDFDELWSSL